MKYYHFILALVLILSLSVFSGCAAADRAEDAIENKLDAAEDALENRVNDSANALNPTGGTNAETYAPVDPAQLITPEEAESIALTHAGLNAEEVTGLHTAFQIDDGRQEYEVEFHSGHVEYEYEIDAATGDIVSYDKDN